MYLKKTTKLIKEKQDQTKKNNEKYNYYNRNVNRK